MLLFYQFYYIIRIFYCYLLKDLTVIFAINIIVKLYQLYKKNIADTFF